MKKPARNAAMRRLSRRTEQRRAAEANEARHEAQSAAARQPTATFRDVDMGYAGPGKGNAEAAIRVAGGKLVGDRLKVDPDAFRKTIDATDTDIELTDSDV